MLHWEYKMDEPWNWYSPPPEGAVPLTRFSISGWWDVSLTQEEIKRATKAAHPSEVRPENYMGPWTDGSYGKRPDIK